MKRSRINPVSSKRAAANKVSTLHPSRKPITHRSAKMQAKYEGPDGRKALVARLLAERPRCETYLFGIYPYFKDCTEKAVDCHERLSRARGGSILDESNIITCCRACHTWITDHPAEATKLGLLKSRWGKHEE